MNDHSAGLGVMYGQHFESPAVYCFLDRIYGYKTVSTQMPQDAGMVLILYTGRNSPTSERRGRTSATSHSIMS